MNSFLIMFVLAPVLGGGIAEEFEFVPDTSLWVSLQHGNTFSIGKLDAAGNFVPGQKYLHLDPRGGLSSVPAFKPLNSFGGEKRVYEYRSGRLIQGKIDRDGNFVPDLGSKVIAFKDYKYGSGALLIYNLPGKFVKKEK